MTWDVVGSEGVIGSVRLKRTETVGVLETGIWLACRARGQGIGTAAAAAVVKLAASLGATAARADTTSSNVQALAMLRCLGFSVSSPDSDGSVHALMRLDCEERSPDRPARCSSVTEFRPCSETGRCTGRGYGGHLNGWSRLSVRYELQPRRRRRGHLDAPARRPPAVALGGNQCRSGLPITRPDGASPYSPASPFDAFG